MKSPHKMIDGHLRPGRGALPAADKVMITETA
jgi:hypothetical protein